MNASWLSGVSGLTPITRALSCSKSDVADVNSHASVVQPGVSAAG